VTTAQPNPTRPDPHQIDPPATPAPGRASRRRTPRPATPRPLDPHCDADLRRAAAYAGIDVGDRDDLLSCAATGLTDLLWHTDPYRQLSAGEPPTKRARQLVGDLSDDEAHDIASWWRDEHQRRTAAATLDLADVADLGELERLTHIVARSNDRYGLPADVVWRLHAATVDTVWTLLEAHLPEAVTRDGAHLGPNLRGVILDEVCDLLADPARIVTCGSARIRIAELFDPAGYADHITHLYANATRLDLTAATVGTRRTLWMLALRAVTTDALRPPLPLWRRSVATLADQARSGAVEDREAGAAQRWASPEHRGSWSFDAATLTAALHTPWRLNCTHVTRLAVSTALADVAADEHARRQQRLHPDGEPATLDLTLYL
jgi:hypothetical protein